MLKKFMFTMLAAAFCVSAAFAQTPATDSAPTSAPAPRVPSRPITTAIPADCAGFIAAENLEKLMDNLLEFVSATDMGDMLQGAAPTGLMPMLTAQLGLGEGFDPKGGFAMVVVNLEKYGFNADDAELGKLSEMPFVLLIAGRNVEEVFAGSTIDEEDSSLDLPRMGNVFFKQVGDYVALSQNKKALDLVGDKMPSIDKVMTASQKKLMAANDMTFFINCKTVMPYLLKAASDQAVKMDDAQRKEILDSARQSEQLEGLTMGLDLGNKGMSFTVSMEYKEGSEQALKAAAMAKKGQAKLNQLPGGKYFLALSSAGLQKTLTGENNKIISQIMDALGNADGEFSGEFQEKLTKVLTTVEEQVKGMQLYVGRNDKGALAVSACIDCENADKLLAVVPEKMDVFREVLTVMTEKGKMKKIAEAAADAAEKTGQDVPAEKLDEVEKIKNVEVTVTPKVAVVEGVTLDALTLDISKCEMTEDERKNVLEIFGDEQIRALYGKTSDSQVIVTFGGGVEFVADAIKAARTGGKLAQAPEVAAVLKNVPQNANTVMLVNMKNIFDAINEIKEKCKPAKPATKPSTNPADADEEEEDEDIPGVDDFTFECAAPILIYDYCEGNVENVRVDVPMPLFNDIIRMVMFQMTKAAMEGKPSALPFPMPGM